MEKISSENLKALESRYNIALINSLSGFKPIVLIGTRNNDGLENLAIFNSLTHIGANPPLLAIVSRPNSVDRHTIENIRDTGIFSINHVSEHFYKKAHQTSARYDRSQSEFEFCQIDKEYKDNDSVPFVKGSLLQIEMKLEQIIPIELNDTLLCLGSVQNIYVKKEFLGTDGFIDLEKMNLVCGSGLDSYYSPKLIARLPYAKP